MWKPKASKWNDHILTEYSPSPYYAYLYNLNLIQSMQYFIQLICNHWPIVRILLRHVQCSLFSSYIMDLYINATVNNTGTHREVWIEYWLYNLSEEHEQTTLHKLCIHMYTTHLLYWQNVSFLLYRKPFTKLGSWNGMLYSK